MAEKYGYMAKIGLQDDGLRTGLKEIDSSLKEIDRSISATDKAISNAGKSGIDTTQLWQQQYDLLRTQIETTAEKLQGLESVQSKVAEAYENGAIDYTAYVEFQNEITNTAAKLEELRQRADDVKSAISDTGSSNPFESFSQGAEEFNESSKSVRQELSKIEKTGQKTGNAFIDMSNNALADSMHYQFRINERV